MRKKWEILEFFDKNSALNYRIGLPCAKKYIFTTTLGKMKSRLFGGRVNDAAFFSRLDFASHFSAVENIPSSHRILTICSTRRFVKKGVSEIYCELSDNFFGYVAAYPL